MACGMALLPCANHRYVRSTLYSVQYAVWTEVPHGTLVLGMTADGSMHEVIFCDINLQLTCFVLMITMRDESSLERREFG